MKKKTTLIVLALIAMNLFTTNITAQCVEKGTTIFDVYYGFPNMVTYYAKKAIQTGEAQNMKATGIGPLGIRGEYLVTDHIGMGADINYINTTLIYGDEFTSNPANNEYYYKLTFNRIRALAKMNFHFGANDHFDWHAGFGIGYSNIKLGVTSNDPDADNNIEPFERLINFPICARIDFGIKYFFTDNIGIGFDIGLGGPFASGGLLVKF